MDTCTVVASGLLTDLARERARAEARETEAMLRFRDAEMPRTTPQRTADLLAAWCTTNQAGEAAVHAQIAVKLPAAVFTAATDGFAEAADGSWSAPAAWVLKQWVLPSRHAVPAEPAHRERPTTPPSQLEHQLAQLLTRP